MSTILDRATFTTSRALEFFTKKELQMQIGRELRDWPIVLLKELIDNALDACEQAGTAPAITVTIEPDLLSVRDNGPGLPVTTLERSLDYMVRVSNKAHYVSPTRGQLGNALKCVWAAPFVVTGNESTVDVVTGGLWHTVTVGLDRIAQMPLPKLTSGPDGIVENGTLLRMHWPGIASYLNSAPSHFYKLEVNADAWSLIFSYAAFNPHATFALLSNENQPVLHPPTCPSWEKWRPYEPTSPHWYTPERLRSLIAAYVADEQDGGRARTVREFVAEFNGLSTSAKQKVVTTAANLPRAYLHDLVVDDDIDLEAVTRLLGAMQAEARPVRPMGLGVIGERHLTQHLTTHLHAAVPSIRYKKIEGTADGLPFVLEVAFGAFTEDYSSFQCHISAGLNWTPVIGMPFESLPNIFSAIRVDRHDPVIVLVHLACPRIEFTDRGKMRAVLPSAITDALEKGLRFVTKAWTEAKRSSDRENRVSERDLKELRRQKKAEFLNIKEASYAVMEEAYQKASAGNTLPANARQIMYAARPLVLRLTGGQCWKKSSYFTQQLLPDFVTEHPELTADWDVVFDARGHLSEPHTEHRVDLGGIGVRSYIKSWESTFADTIDAIGIEKGCPTRGPLNRYRFALFIEKEGFDQLLSRAQIAERFDIAIMSTKGMSTTAARQLVDRLSALGVIILVAHDFDKSGFEIMHTLRSDGRRYQFDVRPRVIDLGLRLEDVTSMDLASEAVEYEGKVDPRVSLRASGASEEACAFLVRHKRFDGGSYRFSGERVELNAMDSQQFITWLEGMLQAAGVTKYVPDDPTLQRAFRLAWRRVQVQEAIDRAIAALDKEDPTMPSDLEQQVATAIAGTAEAWDAVIWRLARAQRDRAEEETA